ncbi:MAG: DUF177 domain-containing protein [Acidobacteria bacterium]|nr:DUF177 domain-containing protein [Acidobacteriota bacterium]
MASPLVVNAAELLRRPGNQKTVALGVPLSDLDVRDDERFTDGTEVDIALELESLSDGIVVDGTVTVPWQGTCRRCLEPTGGVSVSEVHELYQRVITDPDAFEIIGDQIDLKPVAREAVLLDAPTTPLCDPECKGLCPTCGANLNEATCQCAPPPADPRWAALDQLREG